MFRQRSLPMFALIFSALACVAWGKPAEFTDPEQAKRVADKIEAGMVFINAVGAEGVELPFGGVKRSGFGRELGRFGIDEFVNKKLIRTVS